MRVLQVGKYYWPYQRGIETYLKTLCEGLRDRCELLAAVSSTGRRTVREEVNGVQVLRLGRALHLCSTDFTLGLPGTIREFRPDIVHINLPNPWAELSYFLSGTRARLFVSFHSDIVRQRNLLKLYAPVHRRFLARAEKIIVATPNHILHSPFLSQMPKEKLAVVHYGLDPEEYANPSPELAAALRAKYGPFLLAVGQLVYYKGFEVLVEAMAGVPGLKALIIGQGPLKARLQEQIRKGGLQDRVLLLDHVSREELLAAYQACQFLVLPSTCRSEAFGLVQLEAFLAGKPAIATDLPSGVPYVNRHGETGLIVPPGDARALAAAIVRLQEDSALRERLGQGARQRALTEFRADRMVEQTWALYQG